MDWIILNRNDYITFRIKENRHPKLSPDDLDIWHLMLSNEFDRMKAFAEETYNPWKIVLTVALFAFAIFGLIVTLHTAFSLI